MLFSLHSNIFSCCLFVKAQWDVWVSEDSEATRRHWIIKVALTGGSSESEGSVTPALMACANGRRLVGRSSQCCVQDRVA